MSKTSILKMSILLCLLIAACSSFSDGGSTTLTRDLEVLKERVLELQQRATVDRLEIERLRARIVELETSRTPAAPAAAAADTNRPRGIGEEDLPAPSRPVSIEEADLEESSELDPRVADVVPESEPSTAGVGAPAQALYDLGYTLYHQGRYLEAEQHFTRFLDSYGSTDLADNAQYWIGESRLARGELSSALAAFRETVSRYPRGNKAPDAQLKVGRVLESLGDVDGARRAYSDLQESYPLSSASDSAAARLREL